MQLIDILTLHQIPGIGNKSLISLIELSRHARIESLLDLKTFDLSRGTIKTTVRNALNKFFFEEVWSDHLNESAANLEQWQSFGIDVVVYGSSLYPKQLEELSDPPAILFCRGNLNLLRDKRAIAVVGTRENTRLGELITQRTVEHFSKKGFCIVSGLALGIDSFAHRAALDTQGTTIAVLVDVLNVAPSQNRVLADQILMGNGLLIAENPPNTKVIPALFAKRDRIQSGLSLAVFAIETSREGGTMHAVKAAILMKRPVYVPDAAAARYPNIEEHAISGTQMLANNGSAEVYSRDSYERITKKLIELAEVNSHFTHNSEGTL